MSDNTLEWVADGEAQGVCVLEAVEVEVSQSHVIKYRSNIKIERNPALCLILRAWFTIM